jgi:hypothetical protein
VSDNRSNEQAGIFKEASALHYEASIELARQEEMLTSIRREGVHQRARAVIPLALLVLISTVIIFRPDTLLIWLITGLLLYSYNYIILMIPTTTGITRPKEMDRLKEERAEYRWPAIKLLWKKKRLAVDMVLTMFLGGMIPLTLSFTVILSLGLFLSGYFVLIGYPMTEGLALLIGVQVTLIVLFYILMIILEPQAQGITLFTKGWKTRLNVARARGNMATAMVLMAILGMVIVVTILFIGAILLPGITLSSLFSSLGDLRMDELLTWILVLMVQITVMRNLQSFTSRRMATTLLQARIATMKDLLTRMEALNPQGDLGESPSLASALGRVRAVLHNLHDNSDLDKIELFRVIRSEYYAMMIYDVIRLDFFGLAPVYLVIPHMKYLLDERIIEQVPG